MTARREIGTLEAALVRVQDLLGAAEAAHIANLQKSRWYEITSPRSDAMLRGDQLADLDLVCFERKGEAPIADFFEGQRRAAHAEAETPTACMIVLAQRCAREFGEVIPALIAAGAGDCSKREREAAVDEIGEAVRVLQSAQRRIKKDLES
jgi:hypothetical protein